MPSSVKQRLPADMWRQGHRKYSNSSPVSLAHSQEMQASPGCYDGLNDDKQHYQGSKKFSHRSHRKHFHASGRGSPKSLPRRGSDNVLAATQSDTDSYSTDSSESGVLSSSIKSDSYISRSAPDLNASSSANLASAPHPSQLPFPPLEWLQVPSSRSVSPVVHAGISLQSILGLQVAA